MLRGKKMHLDKNKTLTAWGKIKAWIESVTKSQLKLEIFRYTPLPLHPDPNDDTGEIKNVKNQRV